MRAFNLVLAGAALFLSLASSAAGKHIASPIVFEPNRGQTDARVLFLARGPSWTAFFTHSGVTLRFPQEALRLTIVGAAAEPEIEGVDLLPGRARYFKGNTKPWTTGVPQYAAVAYRQVYPGIDLVFHARRGNLEYDFIVAPGAQPEQIQIAFAGAKQIQRSAEGELVVQMNGGELRQRRPEAFQQTGAERRSVTAGHELLDDFLVGFELSAYDRQKELVIDPLLYSTFVGGSGSVGQPKVGRDADGNLYLAGKTSGVDFPTTPGAIPGPTGFRTDIFVMKIDPTVSGPSALRFSTFLSAGRDAELADLIVANGLVYLAGATQSRTFPTTENAFQPEFFLLTPFTPRVDSVLTVLDLSAEGQERLVYSTFLGGSRRDHLDFMEVDAAGAIYLAGATSSPDFPTTPTAFLLSCRPEESCGHTPGTPWIARMDPRLSGAASLTYSTYFRGVAQDMEIDAAGLIHVAGVAGRASPEDFVTTPNAFAPQCSGLEGRACADAFYSVFNAAAAGEDSLVYSTLLGGSGAERAVSLAVAGKIAYLAGETWSSDFPAANPRLLPGCPTTRVA